MEKGISYHPIGLDEDTNTCSTVQKLERCDFLQGLGLESIVLKWGAKLADILLTNYNN